MFNKSNAIKLRNSQGRQVAWLARKCGVEPTTMTGYLSGRINPSKAVAMLMAQALEVPESEIWIDNEQTQNSTTNKIAS